MDTITFENLLNESESDYLDFKEAQYRFDGATDEEKSELLKDIIAFSNAWKRTDAYILIGVREMKGGRSQVVGISNHIDDACLQQFVNSKVQRPITFSYVPFEFEGKQVGIIHIPVQERPFYLKQKYGKVIQSTVYLRRGSSTAIAEPDEVAKMGASFHNNFQSNAPSVDCEFANPESHTVLGKEIDVMSKVLSIAHPIPDFSPPRGQFLIASLNTPNENYYKELYEFYYFRYLLKAVNLRLKNTGHVTAYNARVEITISANAIIILTMSDLPNRPEKYFDITRAINYRNSSTAIERLNSRVAIDRHENNWFLSINFGSIQPKAESWLEEKIMIGSIKSQDIQFEATIFADNAPDPIRIPLCIRFRPEEFSQTLEDLIKNHEASLKKRIEAYYSDNE
jgi:hypothetical protein